MGPALSGDSAAMRRLGRAGLAASAAGTAGVLVLGRSGTLAGALVALLLALVGYAAVLRAAWAGAGSRRAVVATATALLALAVALPPWPSRDLHVYAMQGRILTTHGDNPYVQSPADYPGDPVADRVAPAYRGSRAYYGPAFVAVSAAGASLAGTSALAGRLFFQGLAALAVLGTMALLARRTEGPGALAFLGLNPVLVSRGVNEAHADVLLGLVLAVAVLLLRRRSVAAGACLGLAALVKVVAILPLAGAAAWAWRRRGKGAAVRVALAGGVTTLAGYAAAGGSAALAPLRSASDDVSRASIWTHLRTWVPGEATPRTEAPPEVTAMAMVTVAVLAVALVAASWRDDTPERPVAGPLAAYLLAGPYVVPWYPAGVLAPLAGRWRTGLALLVSAHSGLLGVAYLSAAGGGEPPVAAALAAYWRWFLPAVEAVAVVAAGVVAVRSVRRSRRRPFPSRRRPSLVGEGSPG